MNFTDRFKKYIEELNCSLAELSKASELSNATISRYYSGTRKPTNPSEQLDKLIKGLDKLYKEKKISHRDEKTIREEFDNILKPYDMDKMIDNFNQLISILKINIADFSKILGYDPSYLSRIRSKERKPANPNILFDTLCNYIIKNYNDDESKKILSALIDYPIDDISDNAQYKEKIFSWLCSDYKKLDSSNDINKFLITLNEFNLNEYIRVIKFDELKVPTIPFKIPKSKNYFGLEEMKQGELDFLKATVLSKTSKSVFMYSNMQMSDMTIDLEFGKKWMLGIAMMLKKGLHLNIIHNLDRPFEELMVGLESWIPIYMTGQVSPFYISSIQNSIYSHLDYVSDDIALTGECIKGNHSKGKYYLTNNKRELKYYKEKSNFLLKKAKPLMRIYRNDEKKLLYSFLNTNLFIEGNKKIISSSLPIYTIKNNLLLKILSRNNISKKDTELIIKFVEKQKEKVDTILENNSIEEIITKTSKNEFEQFPISLDLSELFYNKKILYTYEEYLEHYKQTRNYELKVKNYRIITNNKMAFRNIKIRINLNKWVMISKNDNPTIHFIIENPKLCKAIENFVVPIIE